MKTSITPYILRFTFVATVLTIAFRYFLSYGIENKMTVTIALSAILYAICMFIFGWYFGKKSGEFLPIIDAGFRFHLTTYIVYNLISELWFVFGFNSHYEKIFIIHTTALYWGIFLLLHFMFCLWARKNSINGLDINDLLE
jgi:hypothetical protein